MSRLLWRFSGFIEILRIHNLITSAIATLLGFMTIYVVYDIRLNIQSSIPTITTVVLVAGGGYVINDFFDVEVDFVNKPSRPIPSGRVLKSEALALGLTLMIVGVALALLTAGVFSFIYAILNAILLILYSKSLKKKGLLGNIIVGMASANSIVYGGLAASEVIRRLDLVVNTLIPAFYAFVFTVMREIVKGIEDHVGDAKRGVRTLAVVYGVNYAAKISIFLMTIIIIISPLPYVLNMYGVVYVISITIVNMILIKSIATLLRLKDEDSIRRAAAVRSYTKVAMVLGVLAFLLDLILR